MQLDAYIKQLILTFLFFIGSFGVIGQVKVLSADGLGSFWFLNDSKVLKIDSGGKIVSSYSNILLGNPSHIDSSDPFRILIFYQAAQTLVILNNEANAIGNPVLVSDLGLGEVTQVCRSSRGGVLFFHRESQEIVRFDSRFSKPTERFQLPLDVGLHGITCMAERGGVLYLGINNNQIARIDPYGAIIDKIFVDFDGVFRIEKDFLITSKSGIVHMMSLASSDKKIDTFSCQCHSLPALINDDLYCFDGYKFIQCKKIED